MTAEQILYEVHCNNCDWWGLLDQMKPIYKSNPLKPGDVTPEPGCPMCLSDEQLEYKEEEINDRIQDMLLAFLSTCLGEGAVPLEVAKIRARDILAKVSKHYQDYVDRHWLNDALPQYVADRMSGLGTTREDCKRFIAELVETIKQEYYTSGFKQGKFEEMERIMRLIENINSIGYPYGADYKCAIQQALKGEVK